LHANSLLPKKKSKHQPLTTSQQAANTKSSQYRIYGEHMIGKLKVFGILFRRYWNRRRHFVLRFNLVASAYNLKLDLKS
jgi:hypothetical protein